MTRLLPRRGVRRFLQGRDGATTVEFAIVFPMFFVLLLGVIEFARMVWVVNSLQYAVAQGARYATLTPTSLASSMPTTGNCNSWSSTAYKAAIKTYLEKQLAAYRASATASVLTASVSCGANPPTMTITVQASYNFNFFLSSTLGSWINAIPLSQTATVTVPIG
jgi:Flp pilus assembly protein TadG